MTPEDVLRPFLKRFDVPETVVRLLYLLLQREIENGYQSLGSPVFDDPAEPGLRFTQGLIHIFSQLPKIYDLDDSKFFAPIVSLAGLADDPSYFYSLRTPTEYFSYLKAQRNYKTEINHLQNVLDNRVSGQDVSYERWLLRRAKENLKDLQPPDRTPYLTAFWIDLLNFNVSFDLPHRNEHCHILGAPGTGKTELIKKLVYQDMRAGSVIVMAPKGNLISTLAKLPHDSIWINDWSQVGLNLVELGTDLLIWVFEALLDTEPTPKQKAFLYTASSVKTLTEFRLKLKTPEPTYRETAEQIAWRLDLLLSNPVIEGIFSRPTNIDIRKIMDEGKVLLLDTQSLGEIGSPFIGRFIVALIALATKTRQNKNPAYVYLDECPVYITEHIEQLLDMAREANVCLHLAHQTLAQLSPRLKASIHNTAIKFVSRCNYDDASEMAKQMNLSAEVLKNQPRLQFMLSAFKNPIPIKIIPGEIDRFATSHREHFISPHPVSTEIKSTDIPPDPGTGASME